MAKISDYYDLIKPHVLGCPEYTLRQMTVLALRYACTRAMLWNYDDHLYLVKGVSEYDCKPFNDCEVATVQKLEKANGQTLSIYDPGKNYAPAMSYRHEPGNKLKIYATPGGNELLKMELSLRPLLNATEVDDALFSETYGWLHHGALAKLFDIKSVDWGSVERAREHQELFDNAVDGKRKQAFAGQTAGDMSVQRRRFI